MTFGKPPRRWPRREWLPFAFALQRSNALTYSVVVRILDVINKTAPFFEKHGIESPRLNIELLLVHILKKKRLGLYSNFGGSWM